MLDTIPRNSTITKHTSHSRQSNGKLQQVKKCKREALSQYGRAILQYSDEDRQFRKINSNLEETVNMLKSEKVQLQKQMQEAFLRQQAAFKDKMGLEKALKQQQEQLIICQGQKEYKQENQNILRRQNLLYLSERDATSQTIKNEESKQASNSHQYKQLQKQIMKVKASIKAKIVANSQCSSRLYAVEDQNMSALQKINHLQQDIERNTLIIQRKLTQQSHLTNRYGQLKRTKINMQAKIIQIAKDVEEEKKIQDELLEVQRNLNTAHSRINQKLQLERCYILDVTTEIIRQKKEVATNKQCLTKLNLYLDSLKKQNQKIELYIQNVIEEDCKIKAIIGRKQNNSRSSKWQSQTREDKSMQSTLAQ